MLAVSVPINKVGAIELVVAAMFVAGLRELSVLEVEKRIVITIPRC